jgi:hypothetical protein
VNGTAQSYGTLGWGRRSDAYKRRGARFLPGGVQIRPSGGREQRIVGFVVPNMMMALFAVRHGLTFDGYFRHWGESLPATQLALGVSIAFIAFPLWAAWEGNA